MYAHVNQSPLMCKPLICKPLSCNGSLCNTTYKLGYTNMPALVITGRHVHHQKFCLLHKAH